MKNATQAQYIKSFNLSQAIAKADKEAAEATKFLKEMNQLKSDVATLIAKIDEYKESYEAGLKEPWMTGNTDDDWLYATY
jgi:hypothetical protein